MNGENIQLNPHASAPRWGAAAGDRSMAWSPVKTPEGRAEITRRSRALNQRLRTVLLLVDGQRTISQIMTVAVQVGAPDTCLDDLLEMGLVALPEARQATPPPAAAVAAEPTAVPGVAEAAIDDVGADPPADAPAAAPVAADSALAAVAEPVRDADTSPAVEPVIKPFDPASLQAANDATDEAEPAAFSPLPEPTSRLTSELFDELVRAVPARQDSEAAALDSTMKTGGRLDSMMSSLFPLLESAFGGIGKTTLPGQPQDDALEEARRILMREVRSKAPVTGALTLSKLRRATTREQLVALFDEVGSHISLPMRRLSTQQILLHVKGLLDRPM